MVFLSSQTLQNILKIFLTSFAQQKGIERNLLIKKFIKNILYSKEQIQINLYYSEDFDAFKNSNFPSGGGWGGYKKEKGTSVSLPENPQFVLSNMAPLSKPLRTIEFILLFIPTHYPIRIFFIKILENQLYSFVYYSQIL